jgi:hypothetical protein
MALPTVSLCESRLAGAFPSKKDEPVTFISILKELWKRRLLVALVIVVAIVAAVVAVYHVSPSGLSKRSTPSASGSSEVLIDSARSPIAGSKRNVEALSTRAAVFARLMASGNVVKEIAKEVGVKPWEIQVSGPQPFPGEAPGVSEAGAELPYGLTYTQVGELPIISIASRAPDLAHARALAAAAPRALEKLVAGIQANQATPVTERVEIRTLGPATVSAADNGPGNKIALAIFFGILFVGLGLILGVPRLVAAWRDAGEEEDELDDVGDISEPSPTLLVPYPGAEKAPRGKVRQR